MDEVFLVGVSEFLGGFVVDFGEDDGCEIGGSAAGAGGVFGEDGGVVGDAAVEERCGARAGGHGGGVRRS